MNINELKENLLLPKKILGLVLDPVKYFVFLKKFFFVDLYSKMYGIKF
jgi:hypothetical protein